jgi:hypothetical protein
VTLIAGIGGGAVVPAPAAVAHVGGEVDRLDLPALRDPTSLQSLRVQHFVDDSVAILVFLFTVADLLSEGVHSPIEVVTVLGRGEAVPVAIGDGGAGDVGDTVLCHAVTTAVGGAWVDEGVLVVAVWSWGGLEAVPVTILPRTGGVS